MTKYRSVSEMYSKENPLIVSPEGLEAAIQQYPDMKQDFYSMIEKGIVRISA